MKLFAVFVLATLFFVFILSFQANHNKRQAKITAKKKSKDPVSLQANINKRQAKMTANKKTECIAKLNENTRERKEIPNNNVTADQRLDSPKFVRSCCHQKLFENG